MKILISFILSLLLLSTIADAQVVNPRSFASSYGLASDTVTNAGTSYLQIRNGGASSSTVVQVSVVKFSGTVAGTLTLQGSLDGTTWFALLAPNTQTAIPTITATNGSASYHWWISANPFTYYRVSWTGTGTMAASFTAKILSR